MQKAKFTNVPAGCKSEVVHAHMTYFWFQKNHEIVSLKLELPVKLCEQWKMIVCTLKAFIVLLLLDYIGYRIIFITEKIYHGHTF